MSSNLPFSRRAIRRIAALAALILLVVVAGSAGLLLYTTQEIDEAQVAEERALIQRRMDRGLDQMVSDITSASIWDDAYRVLSASPDLDWADENMGGYYDNYLGHTASIIVDGADQPIYYWQEARLPPEDSRTLLTDVKPLLSRIRTQEAQRLAGDRGVGFAAVLTAKGMIQSRGSFYLVAVSTVVPETRSEPWRPGPSPAVVSVRRMDGRFLGDLARDLRISDPHVHSSVSQTEDSLPMIGMDGTQIGQISWTPKTPGEGRIREIYPQLIAAMLVLLAAGLALALHIRAVFRQLEANDAALDKAMQELVSARDEAAQANLAKSHFLANMSHEIRTPLNGVLGMAQVMERDELSPRQSDRLHIIQESGQALLTLLNDILDVSKIEAGKLELEDAAFDLAEIVRSASAPFREIAERKGLGFSVRISETAQGLWRGDSLRVRQVVSNLVSNAVKFTAQGRVKVEVDAAEEGVLILVKDTGVGIPKARLGNLFEKFVQADASTSREFGGSGLGLAISRELVELMGGRISVESELGRGSAFAIHLPLPRCGGLAHVQPRVEQLEGSMRILAVEDNVTNRLILESLLAPLRGSLTVVANGREAVEAVRGGGYELVLMDIQMPQMNGIEATKAIRAWEAETGRPPIPILAVTANVMSGQVADYLAAGMNGVIAKPIETGRLIAAMTEAVEAATRD